MYKVLNLYAGIGGNRKLWQNVDVVAVEIDPEIAKIYQDFFPDDEVIIDDAHEYLLKHYSDGWDFIWSSPPCQTHSVLVKPCESQNYNFSYPDMALYQEIILLKHFSKTFYCVENVKSYYEPFIKPQICNGHYFWANFKIADKKIGVKGIPRRGGVDYKEITKIKGFDIMNYKGIDKRTILRNCIIPELGSHIFNSVFNNKQKTLGVSP